MKLSQASEYQHTLIGVLGAARDGFMWDKMALNICPLMEIRIYRMLAGTQTNHTTPT